MKLRCIEVAGPGQKFAGGLGKNTKDQSVFINCLFESLGVLG
jgi:hypothetical protein